MPDLSDFPPLMQHALRTGEMPSRAALVRATGKDLREIAGLLGEEADEGPEPDEPLGDELQRLVAEMSADWLSENHTLDNCVPDEVRERIEDHCRRQLAHARRLRRLRDAADEEEDA